MKFLRRYWVAGLVLMMVGLHAIIIGYVRSQVARLKNVQCTSISVGDFRFRCVADPENVYFCRVHAVLDPTRRSRGEERIEQFRYEILESSQQLLTQAEASWLSEPDQQEIKSRLLQVVSKHLNEPLVQRLLITDWIVAPKDAMAINVGNTAVANDNAPSMLLQ